MTPQLFYIGIAVTIAVAILNIVNSWMLAKYNVRAKLREAEAANRAQGETEQPVAITAEARRETKRGKVFPFIMLAAGLWNIISAYVTPSENPTSNAFEIATGVSAIVLAIVFYTTNRLMFLFDRLLAAYQTTTERHTATMGRAVDVLGQVASKTNALRRELDEFKEQVSNESATRGG